MISQDSNINNNKQSDEWFNDFYNNTYKKAYSIARELLGNEDDVFEVLNEAYLSAYKKIDTLKDFSKAQAWFNKIVTNKCIDLLRKKKDILFSDIENEDSDIEFVETIENETLEFMPEETLEKEEIRRLLDEILSNLPDKHRVCVEMYYHQELPIKEIAETLDCPEGTIKSRLSYAKKKIIEEVKTLEKKGTTLYGLAPIPFMLWLLDKNEAFAAEETGKAVLASKLGMTEDVSNHFSANTVENITTTATAKAVSKGVVVKVLAGVIAAVMVGVGIFVFNNNRVKATKTEYIEQAKEVNEIPDYYNAYIDVLKDNKGEINNYDWQMETNENIEEPIEYIDKNIALCDINDDKIPELFFFTSNEKSQAELNIYSYINNKAVQLDYTNTDRDGTVESAFIDVNIASATQYVIYKTTNKNSFIIYSNGPEDETIHYRLHEYMMDGSFKINEVNVLQNEYGQDGDLFWQNNNSITSDQFAIEFEDALSSIDEIIMYSGYDDTSIWRRFNSEDALALSYDDMISYLNMANINLSDNEQKVYSAVLKDVIQEAEDDIMCTEVNYGYANLKMDQGNKTALFVEKVVSSSISNSYVYFEDNGSAKILEIKGVDGESISGKVIMISEDEATFIVEDKGGKFIVIKYDNNSYVIDKEFYYISDQEKKTLKDQIKKNFKVGEEIQYISINTNTVQ